MSRNTIKHLVAERIQDTLRQAQIRIRVPERSRSVRRKANHENNRICT